jgi:hypothetical protein
MWDVRFYLIDHFARSQRYGWRLAIWHGSDARLWLFHAESLVAYYPNAKGNRIPEYWESRMFVRSLPCPVPLPKSVELLCESVVYRGLPTEPLIDHLLENGWLPME